MQIVFFGGSILGCRCLEILMQHQLHPLVITNPEDKGNSEAYRYSVKQKAEDFNLLQIDFKTFIKEGYKTLLKSPPYMGLSAFCSRLIPSHIIDLFTPGITNLHFSLLPKYRGQFPTVYAIFNGDKETGVTLHWIDKGTDSGSIIQQMKTPILPHDTGESLFNKCLEMAVSLFKMQLDFLEKNQWPFPIKQKEKALKKNDIRFDLPNQGKIDWSWSGEKIHDFLRAHYHSAYPMPTISIAGMNFSLIRCDTSLN